MIKTQKNSLLDALDIEAFQSGGHARLYEKFGAQLVQVEGVYGVQFTVYAPAARAVEVMADFNDWQSAQYPLFLREDHSGIWEGFVAEVNQSALYKYRIYSKLDDRVREKADPFAYHTEMMPKSASVIWDLAYEWSDDAWMATRGKRQALDKPVSIYELHIGSWRKEQGRSLSYQEMAAQLVKYVLEMGFTHVEFLPLMEYPYYPSWGYLPTSFFAPTSRFGCPQELMYLIQQLHRAGIGVFLDWVPGHFSQDEFALVDFDGSCVYEHPDDRKGKHPDWGSLVFNYEKNEVRSFLISSAHFWLKYYHLDGLRVDAVTSMLYLDYSRAEGEWEPNELGGNEYLAAVDFLKELNTSVYADFPDVHMMAEESTDFPGMTTPVHEGGLGFGLKWMMGWMNDVLKHFRRDPLFRKHHRTEITFSFSYAYNENYIMPLSHDEVVHGKASLVYKMFGDEWQKFANLRLLYGYMYTHPGYKLLFMGSEFGQTYEWNFDHELHWELLQYDAHRCLQLLVRDLNNLYRKHPALYELNFERAGWEWIDFDDPDCDVLCYLRKSEKECLLVVCNFAPIVIDSYEVGLAEESSWEELLNSDSRRYWGSGQENPGLLTTQAGERHGHEHALTIVVPPLGISILKKIDEK